MIANIENGVTSSIVFHTSSVLKKTRKESIYGLPAVVLFFNKLYDSPLRIYLNFFQPTRKRKTKELNTKTGKTKKYYFEAATPYQRVINHPMASEETKQLLQSQYNNLNPVKLLAEIRTLIERLNRTIR